MAFRLHSFLLARVLFISILLSIASEAVANRHIPTKNSDIKQPECHGVAIPGIGREPEPPVLTPHIPSTGSSGRPKYIPGADDTFIPNPGFEVPIPGSNVRHGAPASTQP